MTDAIYGERSDLNNRANRYNEHLEYDMNGNITRLQRRGRKQDGQYGKIDNLNITLLGNQLYHITDDAAPLLYEGAFDFNNASTGRSDFQYNGNGSLISDTGRGIAMIEYDNGNNPRRIQFTNGNVTSYVYSSEGQKLRTVHYTAMPNITVAIGETHQLTESEILCKDSTDYLLGGSLILQNGRIDKYLFAGGYAQGEGNEGLCIARPILISDLLEEELTQEELERYMQLLEQWSAALEAARNSDTFSFRYYNQDHLGNNREVVDDSGNILQVTNYYPFGTPYCDAVSTINPDTQPFKYNGKELDMMHGMDTYDYGARQYNSILSTWDRVDPLAEKYYHTSPYVYCANSPIKYKDFGGFYCGDYITGDGIYLGNDGINDERLYVLKTSQRSFDSLGEAPIAGISKKEARHVIENKDISNKDNFVEIIGSQKIREAVFNKIGDNGTGESAPQNNREYLIFFDKDLTSDRLNEIYCKEGVVGDPLKNSIISVDSGASPELVYSHTHPSGNNGKYRWYQAPSKEDINNANGIGLSSYVFGMGNKTVYIYDKEGIRATLSLDIYKNYKVGGR